MPPNESSESRSELIDVRRAAELLGCTTRMVRKLTSEHKIAFVKVGALTRFRPADIESYIKSRRVDWGAGA
jgi:excisionase family DNA binding protein